MLQPYREKQLYEAQAAARPEEVSKQALIETELMRLDGAIESMGKALGEFFERLNPILAPSTPEVGNLATKAGPSACSAVGTHLWRLSEAVNRMESRIQEFQSRIEV